MCIRRYARTYAHTYACTYARTYARYVGTQDLSYTRTLCTDLNTYVNIQYDKFTGLAETSLFFNVLEAT